MGMSVTEYKVKLHWFNSTEKYQSELRLLKALLQTKRGELILDYGCGIGSAIEYLKEKTEANFLGYDIVNYGKKENWFVDYVPGNISKAYFMHSLAHIPNVEEVLSVLRIKGAKRIVIITPNLNWLNKMKNDRYVPDPTVIQHYTAHTLRKVLEKVGYNVQTGEIGAECEGYRERLIATATIE